MSAHKRARYLSPNRMFDLVWDSESYEAGVLSDSSSEDEGGYEDEPGVSHL
jgi:ribosome-associated toxin RatA of RatAB toxin-antitoxin module